MEKVLYPGRKRLVMLIAVCILFMPVLLAGGGWVAGLACAVGMVCIAARLLPGSACLKLDADGFTIRNCYREERFRWADIETFKLITTRYMGIIPVNRQVGYDFSPTYRKRGLARRVVHALARFDGLLPDNYGMKAKDLAVLLDTWRRQHQPAQRPPEAPQLDAVRLGSVSSF